MESTSAPWVSVQEVPDGWEVCRRTACEIAGTHAHPAPADPARVAIIYPLPSVRCAFCGHCVYSPLFAGPSLILIGPEGAISESTVVGSSSAAVRISVRRAQHRVPFFVSIHLCTGIEEARRNALRR